MTDRDRFNADYRAAWDRWARRADHVGYEDGNAIQGILWGCTLGSLLWLAGLLIVGWIR